MRAGDKSNMLCVSYNIVRTKKNASHNSSTLKFTDISFMGQGTVHLAKCSMYT